MSRVPPSCRACSEVVQKFRGFVSFPRFTSCSKSYTASRAGTGKLRFEHWRWLSVRKV